MEKNGFQLALMFVVMIAVQAVIFNHIVLYGLAIPFVFIYFIVKLPVSMSATKVIFLSFLLGTAMDVFQDTPGMCALACTCLGACRHAILRLFLPREDDIMHALPSIKAFGFGVFSRYVFTLTLLFCMLIFIIESFAFINLGIMLQRIVLSTLLTSLLLVATDGLSRKSVSEKRL